MQSSPTGRSVKTPQPVKEVPVQSRVLTFDEVVLGYSEEQVHSEAARCLQCKNPRCSEGCPVGIDIKKFIYEITQKDYKAAFLTIKEKNNFPAICGRVCPAEYQCRKACVFTKKEAPFASDQAINIHFLERYVGDYGISERVEIPSPAVKTGSVRRAAIVGSGPAGLCCAGELARRGIGVTIFEALHKTGGVLRYGIPPFRLPRDILDFEIDYLHRLGVRVVTNHLVGKTQMLRELFDEGYESVFLGLGAGTPTFLGVPGENLCNVYSANEFLTRVNLMNAYQFPRYHTPINVGKKIVVIGGGNTAMDAARVALRLQKSNGLDVHTSIFYRRTHIELPARRLEIDHAGEEGVQFEFLVQPVGFVGDENGSVKKIRCLRCRLGEPDASGRRSPVPIENSEFETECDAVIIALGLHANTILTSVTPELTVDKHKNVLVDAQTMKTSVDKVYAGGDIVSGEGTVIEAMGMAKKAAAAMIQDFKIEPTAAV